MIPTESYPLTWPAGRPRTQRPTLSPFEVTLGHATADVMNEVRLLGGKGMVISSNFATRKDGIPYANQRALDKDNGAAVYFMYKGKPMCFACDRWNRLEHNLRAIAKTIGALRGIERWGTGSMVEQAFTGFAALPAPVSWWQVLKLDGPTVTVEELQAAWRKLASANHPDNGGDHDKMAAINRARDMGLDAIS